MCFVTQLYTSCILYGLHHAVLYINPAMSMTIVLFVVYNHRMLTMNAVRSQHVDGSFPSPIFPITTSDPGWPTFYGFFYGFSTTLLGRHRSSVRSELRQVVYYPELSYLPTTAGLQLLVYQ